MYFSINLGMAMIGKLYLQLSASFDYHLKYHVHILTILMFYKKRHAWKCR
jgi:hypothetical protein